MRLFLYGTLMAGQGSALTRRLHAVLGDGEAGEAAGAIFAIPDPDGWYPALVPGGQGRVRGMVHAADGLDEALLAALDVYEAGYVRASIAVQVARGHVQAQAWVWQDALPEGALALEDGDFAAFLARTGQRAYGA